MSSPAIVYPGAIWYPADPTNYLVAGRDWSQIERFVVHVTDGRSDPYAVADMWRQPHHGSSATAVCGQDGTLLQCVDIADVAWHAHRASTRSVGLEHCSRPPKTLGPDDPGLPVSDAQYLKSAEFAAWCCLKMKRAADRDTIQGHVEVDPQTTHEDCPTRFNVGPAVFWDWQRYMRLVDDAYGRLAGLVA